MFFTHQLNWLDPPHTSSRYMSRWVLNKEQREGSGGLLVAQDGFLPTHSKDRSFKKGLFPSITACIPWKVQTKLIAALPPMGQEALHLMHCTSQIVTPFQKLPNSISFPAFFPAHTLVHNARGRCFDSYQHFSAEPLGSERGCVYFSVHRPQWLVNPRINQSLPLPSEPEWILD